MRLEEKIEGRTAQIAIIGLGYVGLPLAMEFARAGFPVTGIDTDPCKVESLREGLSYIQDVRPEELRAFMADGRLRAEADFECLRGMDAISICVPTPLGKTKDPDISYILRATKEIASRLRRGQLVVLESTTYPGTTDEVVLPELSTSGLKVGEDFFLAFSPERVDPGNSLYHTRNTPKIIGGVTPRCTEMARALYQTAIQTVVPVSSTRSAEMVKLLENTFRAVNIGLVNEVALMCDRLEIDVWEVIDAAATKPFGFMPFYPGPGLGGHCLDGAEYVFVRNGHGLEVLSIAVLFERLAVGRRVHRLQGVDCLPVHGYQALSFDPKTHQICYRPLKWLFRRHYDGQVVRVRMEDGRKLTVTDGHPLLVWDGPGWQIKRADALRAGDELASPLGVPPVAEWQSEIDLILHLLPDQVARTRVIPKQGHWRDYKEAIGPALRNRGLEAWKIYEAGTMLLETFLALEVAGAMPLSRKEIWLTTGKGASWSRVPAIYEINEEFARLVGYYLAEGCVTSDKSLRTRFAFHADEVEYISDVTSILAGLGVMWSGHKLARWQTYQIKVSSNLFGILLRDVLGCGTQSINMQIPALFFDVPASIRKQLLAGLLRGDGCVEQHRGLRSYRKRERTYTHNFNVAMLSYFSSSPVLFQQVILLLQGLGFHPTVRREKPYLRIYGEKQLAALEPLLGGGKGARLRTYAAERAKSMPTTSYVCHGSFSTAPVREIEPFTTNQMVYSLEVEGTHTFVSSFGLIHHNCIPIDPHYLAWKLKTLDYKARFIELASEINADMPLYVVSKIADALNYARKSLNGSRILILGVSYKRDVSDVRESPSLDIIKILQQKLAVVFYHDPYVPQLDSNLEVAYLDLTAENLQQMDCIVIVTNHSCFDYPWIVNHSRLIVDTRNATRGIVQGREKIVKL